MARFSLVDYLLNLTEELKENYLRRFMEQECMKLRLPDMTLFRGLQPAPLDFSAFTITIDPADPKSEIAMDAGFPFSLPVHSEHVQQPECFIGNTIPFDKFKKLDIRILPTDPCDPAQFYRAYLHITRMLKWLLPRYKPSKDQLSKPSVFVPAINNSSKWLPPVEVNFVDGVGRYWQRFGPQDSHDQIDHEIEMLSYAFHHIRYTRRLTINVPEGCKSDTTTNIARSVELFAVKQFPFGSVTKRDDPHMYQIEADIRVGTDNLQIYLDDTLNEIHSASADQLRLERFANWCIHYENCYQRQPSRLGGIHSAFQTSPESIQKFWDRQDAQLMYALALPAENRHLPLLEQWKAAYPLGIPATTSPEYLEMQDSQYGRTAFMLRLANEMGWFPDASRPQIMQPCVDCVLHGTAIH